MRVGEESTHIFVFTYLTRKLNSCSLGVKNAMQLTVKVVKEKIPSMNLNVDGKCWVVVVYA